MRRKNARMRMMVITHHGAQCFKVTFGDLTLVFDPIAKGGSAPPVRFGADIALVSHNHPDSNGIEEVTYGGKVPFAITGPGEYERSGVTIRGFLSRGPDGSVNTIYMVQLGDMTLVHLGALATAELPAEAREALEEVDVLFVPVALAKAHELAVSLEPHIIVPMGFETPDAKSLATFLKEAGTGNEKVEKLTLKKRDLAGREGSILVITS